MRFLFRALILVVLLAIVGIGSAFYLTSKPYQGFEGERFIDIPKGTSTRGIAELLQKAGVVQHGWTFLLARAITPGAKLQAGEYRFNNPASAQEVLNRIDRGDIFYLELVVPEGQNMFDIAKDVKRLNVFSDTAFLKAARNPASILDLDPEAPSLEGYLWPDTYRLKRTTTPVQLCAAMTQKFRSKWKELHSGANVHKVVTLASLVEREARVPGDRPLVSSVFHNRLKEGMKLDCDPTTVYAALVENRYRGKIYRSDLANPSLWNTYKNAGLPPGPIANPGFSSLQAALHPADTHYLYFVVKPDGSGAHTFTGSLAEHAAATEAYRRGLTK
ncbi:MAG: endolytic transglycosylase MltG [Acidobacteriota bacterium]|nr:endolytic transglycosylase MltG [Acidobacteriota bacterium]